MNERGFSDPRPEIAVRSSIHAPCKFLKKNVRAQS